MKKALIFAGGWEGHDPVRVAARFARLLEEHGYSVTVSDTLECLADAEALASLDLIVPCWTMGSLSYGYARNVADAVAGGVGLAGFHGGMCDAFRDNTDWQFLTGGQFVAHPGGDGTPYSVKIRKGSGPVVDGLDDFDVCSEQYYLHVDPAIEVLATTHFEAEGVEMPVAWTRTWGKGRVFYCSLGHDDEFFVRYPDAEELTLRGMPWAGDGKQ